MDAALDEVQHSRYSLENVFLFRTFHNLLMGSTEQEQGDGKRKGKKNNPEEMRTMIHVSKDSTTSPLVKLENAGRS